MLYRSFLNSRGAGEEIRTPDLRITNALLYQLSYTGLPFCFQHLTFASSAEESNYEEVFDAWQEVFTNCYIRRV